MANVPVIQALVAVNYATTSSTNTSSSSVISADQWKKYFSQYDPNVKYNDGFFAIRRMVEGRGRSSCSVDAAGLIKAMLYEAIFNDRSLIDIMSFCTYLDGEQWSGHNSKEDKRWKQWLGRFSSAMNGFVRYCPEESYCGLNNAKNVALHRLFLLNALLLMVCQSDLTEQRDFMKKVCRACAIIFVVSTIVLVCTAIVFVATIFGSPSKSALSFSSYKVLNKALREAMTQVASNSKVYWTHMREGSQTVVFWNIFVLILGLSLSCAIICALAVAYYKYTIIQLNNKLRGRDFEYNEVACRKLYEFLRLMHKEYDFVVQQSQRSSVCHTAITQAEQDLLNKATNDIKKYHDLLELLFGSDMVQRILASFTSYDAENTHAVELAMARGVTDFITNHERSSYTDLDVLSKLHDCTSENLHVCWSMENYKLVEGCDNCKVHKSCE